MRKIAMVGTTSTGAEAPFDDKSWEIWGVSSRAAWVTRATRWFELHRIDGEGDEWARNWRKAMRTFSHDLELLMFYPEPNLGPNVGAYPYKHIVGRFGTFFMTSTFSWMMALAIDELRPLGAEPVQGEIGVWGVEMEGGTEYEKQRVGFRHFLNMAEQLGIGVSKIVATGLSYEPVPYPLWQDDPLLNKLAQRSEDVNSRLQKYDTSIRLTRTMIAQNKAVMEELRRIERDKAKQGQCFFYDISGRLEQLEKETANLMRTSASLSEAIKRAEGEDGEQKWLKAYLSP